MGGVVVVVVVGVSLSFCSRVPEFLSAFSLPALPQHRAGGAGSVVAVEPCLVRSIVRLMDTASELSTEVVGGPAPP